MKTTHRMTATLFCALLVAVGGTACGGDESSNTSAGTSSPETSATSSPTTPVCQDLADLRASADRIEQAKIGENALPVLSDELTTMQAVLKRLRGDAEAQYRTETDAVQAAADSLDSSIKAASASPSAATLSAVGTSVKALGTSVSNLGDALATTC